MSSPHLKAVLFDVRLFHIRRFHGCIALSKIGGVVAQSPLLAIREYEIEHGIPNNYINCLM
jgi:hypothetical protein